MLSQDQEAQQKLTSLTLSISRLCQLQARQKQSHRGTLNSLAKMTGLSDKSSSLADQIIRMQNKSYRF